MTGAAHRLGRAIAAELARAGARVAVHYGSSRDRAERTVADLEAAGIEARAFGADLTRPEEVAGLIDRVHEGFGRLDVVVNSAASFVARPLEEIEAGEWDEVQALNLRAPFLLVRHAASLLRESDRDGEPAAIVNISDLSALNLWTGFAHHGTSKAGLLHLTLVAARELAPAIRVNALVPGAILPPPGVDPETEEWRRRGERVPLGRTGRPDEVARAVRFLAESDFLTGVVLPVDGGEHLGTAR